jgi:hypothetical protein
LPVPQPLPPFLAPQVQKQQGLLVQAPVSTDINA